MTYEGYLLDDMHAVDVLITILREGAIGHHGVLSAVVSVIDGDDHRVVVLDGFAKFKRSKIVDIKLDSSAGDLLVGPSAHAHIKDVILPVGCIEHLWGIVRVLLLSHTHINANVRITESVVLER